MPDMSSDYMSLGIGSFGRKEWFSVLFVTKMAVFFILFFSLVTKLSVLLLPGGVFQGVSPPGRLP